MRAAGGARRQSSGGRARQRSGDGRQAERTASEEAGTMTSGVTEMRATMASASSSAGAAFPRQTGHEVWDESHMLMHSWWNTCPQAEICLTFSPSSTARRQTTHLNDAAVSEI
ncbi:hypothetical protein [Oryza sativa Japonica Group]|uniref:Uncharacterized protein P0034C09.4 n=1 Tax=Oryza sativa subsp. japonica TaxID=39947 RepID=Q5N7S8_ORYSJ|nr:hypothetical protein [Oryza sativa Japonica Group]